jgi:glycosyltransferase involved in cell wall biosynthesis
MKRPSIALAMIVKDERHNLPRLLESVKDCFDVIHITDTGSTDGTVEYLKSQEAKEIAGCPIEVHDFKWVHDFSVARNASFAPVKTDYVAWLDADDVLSDREAFIHFRDHVMSTADYWIATYHYAFDASGKFPVCSFVRERVIKTRKGFAWKYFVHEACVQAEGKNYRAQIVSSWSVNHMRGEEDIKKDRHRNLKLFEDHERTAGLDSRMTYYYGKELFDAKEYMQAGTKLLEAAKIENLDIHDRIMAIQYACGAAIECKQFQKAIQIGTQGINLLPTRAEYWNLIADTYVMQGQLQNAIPYYSAARQVEPDTVNGTVYCAHDAYERYPTEQLACIYLNQGKIDQAEEEIQRLMRTNPARAEELFKDLERITSMVTVNTNAKDCDDIVITCPPAAAKEWDDKVHEEIGLGGSETAAVELSEYWQEMTGRRVIIFNNRQARHTSKSGVEYRPLGELPVYLKANKPFIHIAWRHAVRITSAPSYVWCHDLFTPGAENLGNYEKILCLSEFHKGYVRALQNIPDDKVMLMKNGIEPKYFGPDESGAIPCKNPNKIIFPSSPDRGLDRAIEIVSRARAEFPDLELHVFYGFDNMRAMGMHEMADRLEGLIKDNPWVKYHGNVKKDVLAHHFMQSAVWLYPADFIETFCITALESLAAGCFPLVRNFGGVVDTLKPYVASGMVKIIDSDASSEAELDLWAGHLKEAIQGKFWERVKIDPDTVSWRTVAREWIEKLGLRLDASVNANAEAG